MWTEFVSVSSSLIPFFWVLLSVRLSGGVYIVCLLYILCISIYLSIYLLSLFCGGTARQSETRAVDSNVLSRCSLYSIVIWPDDACGCFSAVVCVCVQWQLHICCVAVSRSKCHKRLSICIVAMCSRCDTWGQYCRMVVIYVLVTKCQVTVVVLG